MVGTIVTDEAERICHKNGLLFHELLSAFSVADSAVPFRSMSHTVQLHDFRVSFVQASEMAARPQALAEARLAEALTLREGTPEAESAWLSFEEEEGGAVVNVRERDDIGDALAVHDDRMPWYRRFRASLRQSLHYVEPEMLRCPAALLVVVSSSDQTPIDRFKELSLPCHLPAAFQTGQFGSQDVPIVYLLLHDEWEGNERGNGLVCAAELLRQMKSELPTAPSKLLRLNSLPPHSLNLNQAAIWRLPSEVDEPSADSFLLNDPNDPRQRHPVLGGDGARGACLSSEDLLNLRELALELTEKIVIPAVERRVFTLQTTVTQSRKGVKNFVRSLWRKPREAVASTNEQQPQDGATSRSGPSSAASLVASCSPALYRFDRIESQIRLLADSLFVMQDYEAALGHYKLVRDDFKADKAWMHLGSVYEMIALCYHHLSHSTVGNEGSHSAVGPSSHSGGDGRYRREMEGAIEDALKAYFRQVEEEEHASDHLTGPGNGPKDPGSRAGSLAARMATRASLLGTEYLLAASPPKAVDAATLLVNAARKETPLCAAVLLEQAAWAFLHGGNMRKFAFYMNMAGRAFLACEAPYPPLKRQAIRCYASTLGLYQDSSWRYILEDIHSTLGRELLKLGQPERGLYHLLRLLMRGGAFSPQLPGRSGLSPQEQKGLVRELLQACRIRPRILAWVIPRLECGLKTFVAALHRAGPREQPPDEAHSHEEQALSSVMVAGLQVPLVLEETLRVVQGNEEPLGREVEEMKRELERELKTAAVMGEKGGSMREWMRALGRVAKEEARAAAFLAGGHRDDASRAGRGICWRGRDEPITVSVDVANPLDFPITLTDMQITASFEDEAPPFQPPRPPSFTASAAPGIQPLSVEAVSVALAPSERKCLHLRIHPRRCGILRVTGLRWRLLGELWGSLVFQSPGPLLQGTLQQRASRARGPDVRLVSRVVPELPLLEVEWEGLPETVFQGEMVQAALRITNRGLAPAAHVYAKSNLPSWVFMQDPAIVSTVGGRAGPAMGAGVCMSMVGVSGTVFRVVTGALPAGGGCVRIPVWVRGLGGGKQRLRILVRYERQRNEGVQMTAEDGKNGGLGGMLGENYRFAEVSKELCVLPSIAVTPSVSPSYSRPGECVLSLNVSNYRTDGRAVDRQVELHSVMALSRLWTLKPLEGFSALPEDSKGAAGNLVVDWQERTTLHYRLAPVEKEGEPMVFEHNLHTGALQVSSPPSPNPPSLPPPQAPGLAGSSWTSLDFLYVENASQSYRTAREEARRREAASASSVSSSTASEETGGRRERLPLSLGEIKRKEAEKRAREAAVLADRRAADSSTAGSTPSIPAPDPSSPTARSRSPMLGMGMEGSGHGGHLAALVPRGRATINLLLTWRLATTVYTPQSPAAQAEAASSWNMDSGDILPCQRVCRGQHQILNHAVRPLTLDPTTAAPLTITVDAPSQVWGCLGPEGLLHKCQVDVLVTVHNRMTDMPVDFVFEALGAPSGKRQSANKAAASPSFLWVGNTSRGIKRMAPGASVQLPLRAIFLRPGVYDLNRFRFVAHMPASSPQIVAGVVGSRLKLLHGNTVRVPYIFSAQYLIKVSAAPPPPSDVPAPLTAAGAPTASQSSRVNTGFLVRGGEREYEGERPGIRGEDGGLGRDVSSILHSRSGIASVGGDDDPKRPEALVTLVEQARGGRKVGREGEEQRELVADAAPPPLLPGPGAEEAMEDVDSLNTPLDRSLAGGREEGEAVERETRGGTSNAGFSPSVPVRLVASPSWEGTGPGGLGEGAEAGEEGEVEVAEDQTFSAEGQERARQKLELEEAGEVGGEEVKEGGGDGLEAAAGGP